MPRTHDLDASASGVDPEAATLGESPSLEAASGASSTGAGELFQLLRDGAPRTRAELTQITQLARSTVATRVERLLEAGLVVSVGEAESSGGRPASRFAFNAQAKAVLAVDVGARHLRLALTDLNGEVLENRWLRQSVADGPEKVLSRVLEEGAALLAHAGVDLDHLAGVGIGLPGPVEHTTGRVNNPPIMPGWDGFDVPGRLQQDWSVPVLVDNDVNIMALGEHHEHWRDYPDFLFVKLATGIGSGVISGGVLQRGANGTSGDLGHVRVPGGPDVPCHCGNTGCLEALASSPALVSGLLARGEIEADDQDVVSLAEQGHVAAIHAVRQAGRDVGEVLAMCVNMLNPSVIVVGGSLSRAGDQLLAGIRESVYRRSLPLATQRLRIERSRAGSDAGILGAGRLVIEHLLSPAEIEKAISVTGS